ncbi:glycoside hydrolase family 105 protein [Pleurotus eryngii]|uniref:Glycoside hydrolase family 105 protein n=1 Tax=Pleurotus eryngii TaxID=5323 RepID=A0A9P6A7F7_PLEER|nr:glycoside hydrolase family 105 protein [Pleurotus eryngii]
MSPPEANQKASVKLTIKRIVGCLVNIKDETGEFLMTLPDGRVIDTKGWNDWEWTHGIGLYGLLKYFEIVQDKEELDIMLRWFKERFEIGTTKNVNTMSPLLTAAYLHEAHLADYNVHLDTWAEWVMYDMPRTEEDGLQHITYLVDNYQQLWDDTLMMTVLPLAKIGLVLKRPDYVEEAKRQFLLHIKYLQDQQSGLWFHGWTFDGRHHFGKARWGRGNCWATIAIPEFIELLQLPKTDGLRMFLVSSLTAQINALVNCQDQNTGLWHTILDDDSSYLETSATAGFAYGIAKAIRLRLIPKEDRYVATVKKAMQGVLDNVSEEGELKQVSFGTPVFDDIESYKRIKLTSMPYGQSLALIALSEHLRTLM